jgi:hypothetical protein
MSNEQGLEGLEQKRQWLKFGEALAENEKFKEALLSVKPIPKLPNVSSFDMFELNYLANEQAINEARDAIKADPQLWSDGTTIWGKLGEQIADDIERMGAKLIELGFPDPRTDFSNWRIIALMVGADPDGMMDDIFEHAVAYHAKRERNAKQLEAPENQPVAPVVVLADPVVEDGLYDAEKLFVWGGLRYETLTPRMIRVLRLLLDERKKGFPDVSLGKIEGVAKVCITGGMHNQVFKVKRKGWPSGMLHPVHVVVISVGSGVYRLIDPKKVPDKVPGCS